MSNKKDWAAAEAARQREGTRLLYIKPCPICNTSEHVKTKPEYVGYSIYCENCYDVDCVGDPPQFTSLRLVYHGNTPGHAIEQWNQNIGE